MSARPSVLRLGISLAILVSAVGPVRCQTVRADMLPAGVPLTGTSFTAIADVVEMAGGRLLVVDEGDRTVQLLDPRTGRTTPVGRRGEGPGEYNAPQGAYSQSDGTAYVVDQSRMRRLRIAPSGEILSTLRHPDGVAPSTELRGVDREGRLYFQGSPFEDPRIADGRPVGPPVFKDSVEVLRWDPMTARWDTLAWVRPLPLATRGAGGNGSRYLMILPQPLGERDAWVIASDGTLLVVRARPYRVEAYAPGKGMLRGPTIPVVRRRVTAADRDAYRARSRGGAPQFQSRGGSTTGGRSAGPDPGADVHWPEEVPVFVPEFVRAASDAVVWIPRWGPPGARARAYDVVDLRRGERALVTMSADRTIVGSGRGVIFVARGDEEDLQHLEVVRWSPFPRP